MPFSVMAYEICMYLIYSVFYSYVPSFVFVQLFINVCAPQLNIFLKRLLIVVPSPTANRSDICEYARIHLICLYQPSQTHL